jgi:uncharacterized protein YjbJ (UPF0337 family)
MQQASDRSVRELQRETEQTRAGLTQTVEQLKTSVSDTASEIRQRISPENIKAEVSDYVRSRGERMLTDITEAARRNPMQAVAVGASVVYPLLRLAKSIPLPILMVGAGLFFAGSKSGQSLTQKASDMASDLSDELGRRSHDLSDQVAATVNTVKGAVSDAAEKAGEALTTASAGADQMRRAATSSAADLSLSDRLKESAGSVSDAIHSRASGMKESASRVASSAVDSSRDIVAGAATITRDAVSSATDAGLGAAKDIRDKASDYTNRAGKSALDTIQENPLLVAGVGLLIGGLIASALPKSDLEEDLVGNAAAAAKRRAGEVASQGFDAAKNAAGEILENVARQAGAEGLTADKLDETARDIGQRVRRVAESAVTTAFNPDEASQSHTGGGK